MGDDIEWFRAAAAAWLGAHRSTAPRDYGAILPPDLAEESRRWQRTLFEAGYAGLHWPVEFGGRGLTPDHHGAWIAECATAQVPPFLNMVGCVLTGSALLSFGTPQQKLEHLRPILTGERIWCQLFSEPDAGSDLASLTTRAELDGDHYVVDGQKVWCSNGRVADHGILMARTDPGVADHRGLSFLLLDMHSEGVRCRPLRQMNGDAEFDEVFLDGARIPVANLLGEEGQGWAIGMSALTDERGYVGASGIALQRRLDSMAHLGGGGLGSVQCSALVELWTRGHALWTMGRRQGPTASVLGSVAKLGTTELMFDVAVLRAELSGPEAMLDGEVVDSMLTAPGVRIAGGTSQVQRNIIGERVLGLPKEPRP